MSLSPVTCLPGLAIHSSNAPPNKKTCPPNTPRVYRLRLCRSRHRIERCQLVDQAQQLLPQLRVVRLLHAVEPV
jgi:hypothetical protein